MLNDADSSFAEHLAAGIPGLNVRPAPERYLEEPRGFYFGRKGPLALPETTDQVAAIVRAAGKARVGIVPYGGGTGLVSGQIATGGALPLILSLERMNRIRDVYPPETALVAEAGATIRQIQDAAEKAGLLFPLSYASQDSASLGGALAVNSGGLNVLRYGMARDLCLGIEAVLPDGSVFHGLKRLRKDNTGYDLRHLLIGSEGTLGVITAAALMLAPRPANVATAFLAVPDIGRALELLTLFRQMAGEVISAFEIIHRQAFAFLHQTNPDLRQPFARPPVWSILAEFGTGPETDAEALLMSAVGAAMEQGLIEDGAVAQGGRQRAEFWAIRETIPHANRKIGAIASHDISLPLSELSAFLDEAGRAIRDILPARINAFGHLGDGNLHYNIFPPEGAERAAWRPRAPEITRCVHDLVVTHGGSFSAEHGIGRMKAAELRRYGDPAKLQAMAAIKAALDPLGIMNPGAVLSG